MPPKKPQGKVAAPTGKPAEATGLYVACSLTPWDDTDIEREEWGDLNLVVTPHTPATAFFVDASSNSATTTTTTTTTTDAASTVAPVPVVGYLQNFAKDWRRPGSIFSPFKPVVVRPPGTTATGAVIPENSLDATVDESALLGFSARTMRGFKNEDIYDKQGSSPTALTATTTTTAARSHKARRDRSKPATPPFMRAFQSALLVLQQNEQFIPKGQYAWELIYPQQNGVPVVNPSGKYAVKLFWNGAFFKVVIDDRLPTDLYGQSIYTVTEAKEIWPALLAKAMIKVLGPTYEHLFFTDPMMSLGCLLCGYVPQVLHPVRDELKLLTILRDTDVPDEDTPPEGGSTPEPTSSLRAPQETILLGLLPPGSDPLTSPGTALTINRAVRHDTSCTLHGMCAHVDPETKVLVGETHSVHPSWHNVRLPWPVMKSALSSVVVMRPIVPTASQPKPRYVESRQVYTAPSELAVVENPPTTKDAKAAAAAAAAAAAEPQPHIEQNPYKHTRWVVIKSPNADVELLAVHSSVCYVESDNTNNAAPDSSVIGASVARSASISGFPVPTTCTVKIQQFQWNNRCQFRTLETLVAPVDATRSIPITLPAGATVLRIDIDGLLPQKAAFTLLSSSSDITWGDDKEVLQNTLQLTRWGDAGVYARPEVGTPNLWFKRHVVVKTASRCTFSISTLPKSAVAELDAYRMPLPVVETGKGAKGGAAEKGKGKAAPQTQVAPPLTLDENEPVPEPLVDIIAHTEMCLFDLDTNEVVSRSDDGKMVNIEVVPNKTGYIFLAQSKVPTPYPRGLWTASVISDGTFERIEPKPFDDVVVKTGEYKVNSQATVFKFFVTALELATASVIMKLDDPHGGTYTVTVSHNDKPVLTRSDIKDRVCLLEHISLVPPEKAVSSVYAITCTLDELTAHRVKHLRSQTVKKMFAEKAITTDTCAPVSGIKYTLRITSSSPKLEVKEDTSAADAFTLVKQSWARPKDAPPEDTKAKPAKGKDKNAPVDDGSRALKAREARRKYLATLQPPPTVTVGDDQVIDPAGASTTSANVVVEEPPAHDQNITFADVPENVLRPVVLTPEDAQAKVELYTNGLLDDFRQFLSGTKKHSEEQWVGLQKAMEKSSAAWAARRRELLGETDEVAVGKKPAAGGKKK
eukprot:PhM_4_TR15629/c0_g1_i1/m.10698